MKKLVPFLLVLSLFYISACTDSTSDPDDDTPIMTDDTDDNGQTGTTGDPRQDFPANFQATGSSGADILSNGDFDRLLIEVAHVEGFRPTQSTLDAFEEFLREFSFKENIEIDFLELQSPAEETLTLQEISDLEIDNRTAYNDGSTLAVYIYFADAPSEDDDEDEGLVTLGAVYRNTSMVIYESTIRNLAIQSSLISTTDLETATLNHEFGHLFGLVNLGTPMINDHEDTFTNGDNEVVGNNHCRIEGCLMRAELQFTAGKGAYFVHSHLSPGCQVSAMGFLKGLEDRAARSLAIVPVLETQCRLDIEGIGARVTSNSAKGF